MKNKKNDKQTFYYLIEFIVLVIISFIYFGYTNNVVFKTNDYKIVDSTYPTIKLIINSIIIIISLAIVEISVLSFKKLPKDKDDYGKALVVSNIVVGTMLNLFIIFLPIAIYVIKCA